MPPISYCFPPKFLCQGIQGYIPHVTVSILKSGQCACTSEKLKTLKEVALLPKCSDPRCLGELCFRFCASAVTWASASVIWLIV